MFQNFYISKTISIFFAFYVVFSVFLPPIFGNLVLHSFSLFGFFLFIRKKISVEKDISLYFALLSLLIFIYLFITTYINAKSLEEIFTLRRLLHYLTAPGLLFFLYFFEINLKKLVMLFKTSLVFLFFVSIIEYGVFKNSDFYRTSAFINSNQLSAIILFLLSFSWVNYFQESKLQKIITLCIIFLGFYTLILSGSRGPIVVAIFISIALLFYFYKYHSIKVLSKYIFFITSVFIVIFSSTHAEKRFNDTVEEFVPQCIEVDCSQPQVSDKSISLRFFAWKNALENVNEIFSIGVGFGKSVSFLKQKNIFLPDHFDNLHNDFIEVLLSGGIVSLFLLIVLITVPLIFFYQNLDSINTRPYAILGISASFVIIGISLSHESLTYKYISGFYIFLNLLFLKEIIRIKRNNS